MVVSDTESVPVVSVPAQPLPPKSAQKQSLYKLRSSTKQLCSSNSRYIHPSWYQKCSTYLAQLLIQEYDRHIAHLYHPVTGAKETYDYLHTQDPVKWETSFSNDIGRLAQGVDARMKTGNKNILFIPRITALFLASLSASLMTARFEMTMTTF